MAEKKPKEAKKPAPEPEAPPSKGEGAGEAPARGGGKLKLIVIVVAAMVIGGAGAFAAMRFLSGPKDGTHQAQEGDEFSQTVAQAPPEAEGEEPIVAPTKGEAPGGGGHGAPAAEGEAAAAVAGPQTVDLKPFTTNLNDSSGRRFLKVSLSMDVDDQAAADELNRRMSDITDKILMLLSSQSMESISTVEGKERLRSQILREANAFMPNRNEIKKVKYSEFIIQ
ncbi:MAG: flagellar basal body-associated FliL family protein [Deltaproteobacteria bacterium]|nr:flagellar basal body-associated FliL family protein [Deltaproteobacteria bacterium]